MSPLLKRLPFALVAARGGLAVRELVAPVVPVDAGAEIGARWGGVFNTRSPVELRQGQGTTIVVVPLKWRC
jgi:hypothetical protein